MSVDGKMVEGTVQDRTRQVLANLKAVVEASGYSLADSVKATCYLSNLERDFEAFNEVSGVGVGEVRMGEGGRETLGRGAHVA